MGRREAGCLTRATYQLPVRLVGISPTGEETMSSRHGGAVAAAFLGCLFVITANSAFTQPPGGGKGKDFKGGFGPPGGQERKLVKEYDKNGDGWLNKEERARARESL